jgi:hypothetical protein
VWQVVKDSCRRIERFGMILHEGELLGGFDDIVYCSPLS